MSVLETPRIYFRGQVVWDPIVTNNADQFYDETTSEPIFPSVSDKVLAFRTEAIAAVNPTNGGLWNPHGTHRSSFYDAAISGADLGGGPIENDTFVNSPARFTGMLVDLEPYGSISSQLFFDSMTFGIDGGYRITAPRNSRLTSRYISFYRNPVGYRAGIASVVWQACFAKTDGLRIDAFDSEALQALKKALEDDDVLGLTVQWNAYRTIYYDCPEIATNRANLSALSAELIVNLSGGGFQPNPARSMMVGVIGLWRKGEPANEPCDRALIIGPDDSPTGDQYPPGYHIVASAHARLTGDSLTLDLSNSISETGLDLVKQDLGDLTIVAVDSVTGDPITLGSISYAQYDTAAYLRSSGIVTIPVDPAVAEKAASADLQFRDASGKVLLTEYAQRALPLVPNLYANQGESPLATFQVYERGVPAGGGIPVTICVMSADSGTVESSFQLVTATDGTISFPLISMQAGITAYVALPGPNPVLPTQGIDPQVNTFMYARILPADADVAQLEPTWDNVYARVLANWKAMAPCMDNWLDLADKAQVVSFASMIRKLTAESAFENFRYMPVTRDLTAGERTLLYNFLNKQSPPAEATAKMMTATPEAVPETANFAERNRAMRSD